VVNGLRAFPLILAAGNDPGHKRRPCASTQLPT
jgi:hypothetical protein